MRNYLPATVKAISYSVINLTPLEERLKKVESGQISQRPELMN